jgi:Fe-S-cluster containining protein
MRTAALPFQDGQHSIGDGRLSETASHLERAIHPACDLCRGACCEVIAVRPESFHLTGDERRLLEYRGTTTEMGVVIKAPCCKLGESGLCTIYANRPQTCHDFEVGGFACMIAVHVRRLEREMEILRAMNVRAKHQIPSSKHQVPSTNDGRAS